MPRKLDQKLNIFLCLWFQGEFIRIQSHVHKPNHSCLLHCWTQGRNKFWVTWFLFILTISTYTCSSSVEWWELLECITPRSSSSLMKYSRYLSSKLFIFPKWQSSVIANISKAFAFFVMHPSSSIILGWVWFFTFWRYIMILSSSAIEINELMSLRESLTATSFTLFWFFLETVAMKTTPNSPRPISFCIVRHSRDNSKSLRNGRSLVGLMKAIFESSKIQSVYEKFFLFLNWIMTIIIRKAIKNDDIDYR